MKKIIIVAKAIKRYITNPFYRSKYIYTKYYEKLKINENQILLESFMGLNINGNPYYLLLELCKNPEYAKYNKYIVAKQSKYEYIKKIIDGLNLKKVEVVVRNSKNYCKLLAQAKYLINNVSFPEYFIKKEGQIYLHTWHGTAFKGAGRSTKDNPHGIGNVQRNFLMSDYLLYPNYHSFEILKRDYMLDQFFTGKYLIAGYPRNEVFFKENKVDIRKELNIEDKKIVVYMPTFREEQAALKGTSLDKHLLYVVRALFELEKKLDEDTIVYVKLHHLTEGHINYKNFKKIRRFPREYETNEFLNIADALITDYSSVLFDFANTGRKIILYTYDKEEYMGGRSVYFDVNQMPFPSSDNLNDVINEIRNIDKYKKYDEFKKKYCEFDSAEASKIVCNYIFNNKESEKIKVIEGTKYKNNKKNILIYAGELTKNGITTALKGIINNVDLNKYNYVLTFLKDKIDSGKYEINEFDDRISYIPIQGVMNRTIAEKICEKIYYEFNIKNKIVQKFMNKMYAREVKRAFPTMKFDYAIHYTGYNRMLMHLFRNIDAKRIIYVHNNLAKERKIRNNIHMNSLRISYKEYDKIVVIRESMIKEIKENVKNLDESKIYVAHNINNIDIIRKKSLEEVQFDEDTYSNYNIKEIKNILEDKNKLKFINIARYSKEKGLERLISAFEKFRKTNEDAYLIIIGGHGKEFKEIKNMVINNKINNVILIRSLRNPYPILKKCNAYILSSFYEGLPMTIMEALILKKPVISTNITGPKEFLEQGYGYLVENSEEGLLNGMIEYQKGNLNNLKEFDAEEFNQKAIQEFYNIIEDNA